MGYEPAFPQRPKGPALEELVLDAATAARPPDRMSVSEAAAKYRYLNNPGSFVGWWDNDVTPYLVEPMDCLTSRELTGMVFVGPAQSGKTDMVINYLVYSAVVDPGDMMIVQTSQITARDFSIRRIDRLHRHSKAIADRLVKGKHSDNTFDKHYTSGMFVSLSWPSVNELSGKPIPRLWLTDYDRMPQDLDGEGAPYDLAANRARTFRSNGMCVAESSPSHPVEKPKWVRSTPHEAPPAKGILGLYNRGDRRRWYWRCVQCHHAFEPSFDLIEYPDTKDIMEAAESAFMRCPHCGVKYRHDNDGMMPGKHEMNKAARWVPDNMLWLPDGTMAGTRIRSHIGSFWLKGPAAAFSDWKSLVSKYLSAEREYEASGSEDALRVVVNTDLGEAYIPKLSQSDRAPESLQALAMEIGSRVVPESVRFLIACIDVQKNRFVVQVHGVSDQKDIYVIDRFDIQKSRRFDDDGERKFVNPGAHAEDWRLIYAEVLRKTYPLADGSGRRMAVKFTVCDSGGRERVTANAYDFYRWLRNGPMPGEEDDADEDLLWEPGYAARFLLLKGASTMNAPRVSLTYPDSERKDRMAGARGEVPVLLINTNTLKDMVDKRLDRKDPGGRYVFAKWLGPNFYTELTVEVRDPRKGWLNPKSFRNESWDLLAYCMAAVLTREIGLETMRMTEPPSWAAEWEANSLVFNPIKQPQPYAPAQQARGVERLAKLGESLG